MFLEQVKEQLRKMSDSEKEAWIIERAKLQHESDRQDFLMSLSGKKKVIYMPSQEEIDEIIERIESGEIYVEYETHYYEFDSDGRYMDDWEASYNDPFNVMGFLNRVFRGCHDLMLLDEYETVVETLDKVCNLKFEVKEAPDSEDSDFESQFTLEDADSEGMIKNAHGVGADWLTACIKLADKWDSRELAERLIEVLTHPFCTNLNPSTFKGERIPYDLFSRMAEILGAQISEVEGFLDSVSSSRGYYREKYEYDRKLKRLKELLLNINIKCIDKNQQRQLQAGSYLAEAWNQINELFSVLKKDQYTNEQWEIEEVFKICDELLKSNDLKQEDWELRRNILSDIIRNNYYRIYGCYDKMSALVKILCWRDEEFLALADIMDASSGYKRLAADLYHKYGRDDKYVAYLESQLGKESNEYIELMFFYKEHDMHEDECRIAELALAQCKEDITDAFICLLTDAKARNDEEKFKKLYSSAKRRQRADIRRIDKALSEMK